MHYSRLCLLLKSEAEPPRKRVTRLCLVTRLAYFFKGYLLVDTNGHCHDPTKGFICKLGPPKNLDAYVQKCYDWVAATHDLMPDYEHWNEPWVDEWACNGGTAEEYTDMIRRIWKKVKADPNVNLIGGGSLAYNRDIMYAKGNDIGYVDGSVNHAYAFPSPNAFSTALMQLTLDKKFSKTQGQAGAWQTEFGTFRDMFSSDHCPRVRGKGKFSCILHLGEKPGFWRMTK